MRTIESISEILEAVMLLCFGLSWPISLYKNIRAGTAEGMSLPFILLICSGYCAGIIAKLVSRNISFVLVVYVLNITVVAANIAVYFKNRGRDKRAAFKHDLSQGEKGVAAND